MNLLEPTRIRDELAKVTQHWTPRVVGRVNDQYVKVAKLPKGVQHNPVADEEVGIVLIETVTTAHTGDVVVEGTVPIERQLRTE